jgi:ATP/maltotriose-dependent transcriptional regulator MalT/DNA-binding SARP family transcriptional activator
MGAIGQTSADRALRQRLSSRLADTRVGLVWAAGGYGKSTLAVELRELLGCDAITVGLAAGSTTPEAIAAQVRRQLRASHRSDALAAMESEPDDVVEAFRSLGAALSEQRGALLLVFDDLHHAGPVVAAPLLALIEALPERHRLLLLARGPVAGFERLESSPKTAVLTARDLAFTTDEILALSRQRLTRPLSRHHAEALRRATDGWAAAVVLAVGRVAASADPDLAVLEQDGHGAVLAHLLSGLLRAAEEPVSRAVVQLAHLPLISYELANAVGGPECPGLFDRLLALGLPVSPVRDGWSEMPGPVAEHLARLQPLAPATAIAASEVYVREGELTVALSTLLAAEQSHAAARIVAELPAKRADRLGHVELSTLVASLPRDALAAHPRVLVHLARACEPTAQLRLRAESLERASALVGAGSATALRREIDVELARDLVRDGDGETAAALAGRALADAGEGELVTRTRALTVLGQVAAARREPESLTSAQAHLEQAALLCRSLGRVGWTAQVLLPLAISVHYTRGELTRALERLDEILAELPARSRHRPVVLDFQADILIDLGRYEEATVALEELAWLAETLADPRAAGYCAWTRARMHSQRGDAAATVTAVAEAEAHGSDWFAHRTGAEFLAESADLLSRVGKHALAARQLERARQRAQAQEIVALSHACLDARTGDPERAIAALAEIEVAPGQEPRERWRLALLRAYAAWRAGRPDAAELASVAFERAAALGFPALPLYREPDIARQLLPLAVAAGSAAARGLEGAHEPLRVSLLGGFTVTRGGDPVAQATGRPATLLKLVALAGGSIGAEAAAAALWPEVDLATSRRRLRNVLNRLQIGDVALVERDRDALRVPEGTMIDVVSFEDEARRALAARPLDATAARRALALYRGEVLPGEHGDWIGTERERVHALYVGLLDRLAEDAEAREDYDEAARLLSRALETDRYDERRYLLLAGLLAEQDRRGAALQVLEEGARALTELGLAPSPAHAALSERLRGASGTRPGARSGPAGVDGPPSLPASDYRATLELLGEIHDAGDLDELRRLLVPAIRRLAPADWTSYNEMGPDGRPVVWLTDPEVPSDLLEAWQRLGHTNPLVERYIQTRDGRPYRFSDVIEQAELEQLPLYREFYLPLGIRHQIAFTLPAPEGITIAVVLSRNNPDFTDRERALLDFARPYIIQAYRKARDGA